MVLSDAYYPPREKKNSKKKVKNKVWLSFCYCINKLNALLLKNLVANCRLCCLLLFLFCYSVGHSQLKVDFTATVTSGCAPLIVQFNDATSGGDPSSYTWNWDLGNGITSTLKNPGALYNQPGTYTVKLVVKDGSGAADSITKTGFITVHAKPVVDFDVNPQGGCSPLQVLFTDRTDSSQGSITAWSWDFGDGQPATVKNPLHTYITTGSFDVTLTATNQFGCSNFKQKQSVVTVNGVDNADFDYRYNNACSPPTKVTFTSTVTTSSPITYQWIFGDGGSSGDANPVYTYNANGRYNVLMVITTSQGCKDTVKKQISIGTVSPNFKMPQGGCVNQKIQFADSSSPSPVSLKWSFGDGGTATTLNPAHTFTATGQYNIKLVANFGSCIDSITKVFPVTAKPATSFSSTGTRAACALPSTIQFQNTTTGGASYLWKFGDGTTSTEANPAHTYTKAGFYDVTLIAFNSNGCADTLVSKKYVQLGPPKIDNITGGPFSNCTGANINFAASISSGETIAGYKWDFGDGSATSASATPTHSYTGVGTYNITLIVTTSSGCTATSTFNNKVKIGNKPTVSFNATPTDACASQTIQFNDNSTGNITDWLWNFGDNATSNLKSPTHLYTDTGRFNVSLTVGSNGCSSTMQLPGYIHVNAPIALFSYKYTCGSRLTRSFTDKSIGAQTWAWDFGDGATSSTPNPSHTYAQNGTYYVSLTITHSACTSTITDTLVVVDATPSFTYSPASASFCKYDSIKFNAVYNPAYAASFYWDFGDGTKTGFSAANAAVAHAYKASGAYLPMLVVRDVTGCLDTAKKAGGAFNIYGPKAAFINTTSACVKNAITFTDKSTPDSAQHAIVQYIWDYGDGSALQQVTAAQVQHVYNKGGIFNVKLKVVDNYGCYDTLLKYNADTIGQPVASFAAQSPSRCSSSPVNFIDSSKGMMLAYTWNFGDNNTSSSPAPQHLYSTPGTYTVMLNIVDRFGCKDSVTRNNYIQISNPKAAILLNDTVHYCPPWKVTPKSQASNYTFLTWNFGDGNSSGITNPEHLYIAAGTYKLMLIAQGNGNCFDTATKTLVLNGPSATLQYPSAALCAPGKVLFTANGKNIAAYQWLYGDGQIQAGTSASSSYTYTTPGIYLPAVNIIDSSGNCEVLIKNKDSIRIAGIKARFGAVTGPACDSAMVSFTDSSIVQFDAVKSITWNFGDNTSSSANNPTHYYNSAGTKKVLLNYVTATGCTSTYSLPVDVVIHKSPVISAVIPASACISSAVNFTASNSAGQARTLQWLWQFGDGNIDTSAAVTHTYTTAGSFTAQVKATNEFGCADTVTGNITVQPLPGVYAGADTVLCLGQSMVLQPSGAATYVWMQNNSLSCTNCANPVAKPGTTTQYFVAGTSAEGCSNIDSITVKVVQPVTVTLQPVDTLCAGHSIQLSAPGAEVYSWQPSTGLSDAHVYNPLASPTVTTTYTVTASDSNNCFTTTAAAVVQVYQNPTVSIADSAVTIKQGDSYTPVSKTSADVIRWQWLPPVGLSCNNCAVPVIKPRESAVYSEVVYNQYGCADTASVSIKVLCNNQNMFIPNTFSPNGDGMNDYFFPRGVGLYNVKSMRVFNRWGRVVFEKLNFPANNPASGWDGKYNGVLQPAGVYVYVIEIVCDNGTVLPVKGDITLLR